MGGGGKAEQKTVTPPPSQQEIEAQKKSAALTDFQTQEAGLELTQDESGNYVYKKRAPTPEEQARIDRQTTLEDLAYKKLTGTISPEDRALVEQEYGAASTVGRSNIQSEFQRALEELNIGGDRLSQDIQQASRENAASRGLNMGDTPIAGEREQVLSRASQDVTRSKRMLGEDLTRNVTNLETNLQGAKAGSMLDVGYRQQMFGQAITQFQSQLQQQALMNRATIQQAMQGTAMGLGQLRTAGSKTITSTGGGQSGAGIAGGALGGAASGAMAGMALGPWGALAGAAIGGIAGGLSSQRR